MGSSCSWDRGGRVAVIRVFITETECSGRSAGRYVRRMERRHGRCVQPLSSEGLCAARERRARVHTGRTLLVHTGTPDTPVRARTYTSRPHNNPVCVSAPPAVSLALSASGAPDCAVALRGILWRSFQDVWAWICGFPRRVKMAGIPGTP